MERVPGQSELQNEFKISELTYTVTLCLGGGGRGERQRQRQKVKWEKAYKELSWGLEKRLCT